jgi:hypothetical protein
MRPGDCRRYPIQAPAANSAISFAEFTKRSLFVAKPKFNKSNLDYWSDRKISSSRQVDRLQRPRGWSGEAAAGLLGGLVPNGKEMASKNRYLDQLTACSKCS